MPAGLKRVALIVAGGAGTRMGNDIPKQFLLLNGLPVLMHSIEKFQHLSDKIIVVLPAEWMSHWEQLCQEHNFSVTCELVAGGSTRAASVKNGLAGLDANCLVAVHDAARPLFSKELAEKLYIETMEYGSAVPVIALGDSLRVLKGEESYATDRSVYRLVQTPQCFLAKNLLKAFEHLEYHAFTDEASLLEADGQQVHLVKGEPSNIKLTLPEDFFFAEYYLRPN